MQKKKLKKVMNTLSLTSLLVGASLAPINVLANDARDALIQEADNQQKPENLLGESSFQFRKDNFVNALYYTNWGFGINSGNEVTNNLSFSLDRREFKNRSGKALGRVEGSDGSESKIDIYGRSNNSEYDPNLEVGLSRSFKTEPGKLYKASFTIKNTIGMDVNSPTYTPYVTYDEVSSDKKIGEQRSVVVPGKVGTKGIRMELFFEAKSNLSNLVLAGKAPEGNQYSDNWLVYGTPEVIETSPEVQQAYLKLREAFSDGARQDAKILSIEKVNELIRSIENLPMSHAHEKEQLFTETGPVVAESALKEARGWFTDANQTELKEGITRWFIDRVEKLLTDFSNWPSGSKGELESLIKKAKSILDQRDVEEKATALVDKLLIDSDRQLADGVTQVQINETKKSIEGLKELPEPVKSKLLARIEVAQRLLQDIQNAELAIYNLFTSSAYEQVKENVTESMIKAADRKVDAVSTISAKNVMKTQIAHAFSLISVISEQQLGNHQWLIDEVERQLAPGKVGEKIKLNDLMKITKMNLSNQNLAGQIPQELTLFKKLTALDLSNNKLVGSIAPELLKLSYLKNLQLTNNQVTLNSKEAPMLGETPIDTQGTFMNGQNHLTLTSSAEVILDKDVKMIKPFDKNDPGYFGIATKEGIALDENHTYKIIDTQEKNKIIYEGKADANFAFPIDTKGAYQDSNIELYRRYQIIMDEATENPNNVTEIDVYAIEENNQREQLLKNASFALNNEKTKFEDWTIRYGLLQESRMINEQDEKGFYPIVSDVEYAYEQPNTRIKSEENGLQVRAIKGQRASVEQNIEGIVPGKEYTVQYKVNVNHLGGLDLAGMSVVTEFHKARLELAEGTEPETFTIKEYGKEMTHSFDFVGGEDMKIFKLSFVNFSGEYITNISDLVIKEKYADYWNVVDRLFIDSSYSKLRPTVTMETIIKAEEKINEAPQGKEKEQLLELIKTAKELL